MYILPYNLLFLHFFLLCCFPFLLLILPSLVHCCIDSLPYSLPDVPPLLPFFYLVNLLTPLIHFCLCPFLLHCLPSLLPSPLHYELSYSLSSSYISSISISPSLRLSLLCLHQCLWLMSAIRKPFTRNESLADRDYNNLLEYCGRLLYGRVVCPQK